MAETMFYRKVQRQRSSKTDNLYSHLVVIPTNFCERLKIQKGSLIRFTISKGKEPYLKLEKCHVLGDDTS